MRLYSFFDFVFKRTPSTLLVMNEDEKTFESLPVKNHFPAFGVIKKS